MHNRQAAYATYLPLMLKTHPRQYHDREAPVDNGIIPVSSIEMMSY
jgi:hypothetical protein